MTCFILGLELPGNVHTFRHVEAVDRADAKQYVVEWGKRCRAERWRIQNCLDDHAAERREIVSLAVYLSGGDPLPAPSAENEADWEKWRKSKTPAPSTNPHLSRQSPSTSWGTRP